MEAKMLLYISLMLILCSHVGCRDLMQLHGKLRTPVSTAHERKMLEWVVQGGCEGPKRQCVARNMMEVHADYIYTQDIKSP